MDIQSGDRNAGAVTVTAVTSSQGKLSPIGGLISRSILLLRLPLSSFFFPFSSSSFSSGAASVFFLSHDLIFCGEGEVPPTPRPGAMRDGYLSEGLAWRSPWLCASLLRRVFLWRRFLVGFARKVNVQNVAVPRLCQIRRFFFLLVWILDQQFISFVENIFNHRLKF